MATVFLDHKILRTIFAEKSEKNIANRLYLSALSPYQYLLNFSDVINMHKTGASKIAERCLYIRACYLAAELKCFGYKGDCPLYQKSNGKYCDEKLFNEAMDELINKTRSKYKNFPQK